LNSINISTSEAIFRWRPAAWLRVSGPDAAAFLQGQFTNDLRGLERAAAVYGLWLNVKGKVVADSFVLRGAAADEFWIGSYFSAGAAVRERLESHIIADDVTVEDLTGQSSGLTIFGADVEAVRAGGTEGFVFAGRRGRERAVEWVFPAERSEAVFAQFRGRPELDAAEMERRRIDAAIPAIPQDVGPNDLPNEAALEADAISYTKGCYLGQEVMARLKSMGQVRRRLLRVRAPAEIAPVPAALFAGEKKIGDVRSVARDPSGGCIGLAMLTLLNLPAAEPLSLAPGAPPTVELLDRP
jgi:folate-binding protein YgfZ